MRTLMLALLLMAPTASIAAENCFVSAAGEQAAFVDDGENSVTLTKAGASVSCSWAVTPDEEYYQDIACEDGTKGEFWFAGKDAKSSVRDRLVFRGEDWLATDCAK